MRVKSVNVGVPQDNPWKRTTTTGIDKRPVVGPVHVAAPPPKGTGEVGLAGDHAYDIAHHGGADQAVYAYAREDLDHWSAQLGRPLNDGMFGENLTTHGIDVNGARIGDRWRVGPTLLLEVSCPRIPCATFEGWMGVPGWNAGFLRAGRPGAYLRVLEPGPVSAGDAVELVGRPDHEVTVELTLRALTLEPELLVMLESVNALPAESKALVRRRLARPS